MSRSRRKSNVVKFKRMPDFNVGFIIFIVIFLYVIASVVIYAFSDKTTIYEVNTGALTTDTTYNGLIIRDEKIVKSEYSGTVNYFVRSRYRVGVNNLVYSVDETGRVAEQINAASSKDLSSGDLSTIREALLDYSMNYDSMNYSELYTTSQNVTDLLSEFRVNGIQDTLDDLVKANNEESLFHKVNSTETGLVVYSVDGYESKTEKDLTPALFDESGYSLKNLQKEKLINTGDPAYKLITDDSWHIYIKLNSEQQAALKKTKSIDLTFTESGLNCKADFEILTMGEHTYGKISLNKYVINFLGERFVKIDIGDTSHTGLKIPTSAVFKKNFYTIPVEYLTASGTFVKQYYTKDGTQKTEAVSSTIYERDSKYCYVSMKDFSTGDTIKKADSDDTYAVGTIGELSGVYCVNKGYAIFKKIDIIGKNSEYYVVKRGTSYGLSIYDHIVLDYTTVKENELVN